VIASGAFFGTAPDEVRVDIVVMHVEKRMPISPGAEESMNVDESRSERARIV
jgi:hypothetical protein